ncbi:rod-binding protein [Erythrobacter sp. EC-HK427]|uniref:rod-binding protein n=1 Tax=Erythrobacter sp. EC-HK427 TaxID=2038396 RepID=UPI001255D848|nr:rod-binding protein [Erythrobacter sp. EC-HK427]VVT01600.1 Peptidoglycan hydrolase (modular protein) [Erythrobacter sp. EC-HK427]
MTPIAAPTPLAPSSASAQPASIQTATSELREAAEAFEAIFIRQLLASARAANFGGEPLLGGPGLEQFTAMRDEHFADIASQAGAFRLADAIERQLSAFVHHGEAGP